MGEFEWDKNNQFWGAVYRWVSYTSVLPFYLLHFTFYLSVFVFRTGVGACIFSLYMYIRWVPGTEAR